jgi:hypothetical protein
MKRIAVLLPLALLAALPARADEVISDEWGILQLMGADVGYVRTLAVRKEDEAGPLFELTIEMQMVMRRGSTISIRRPVSRSNEGGALRLESRMAMSKQEQPPK